MSKEHDRQPISELKPGNTSPTRRNGWRSKDGLVYAALHLRMAIESLTYERTQAYREFLPPENIAAWQPRRVLEALLEIDPRIGGCPGTLSTPM